MIQDRAAFLYHPQTNINVLHLLCWKMKLRRILQQQEEYNLKSSIFDFFCKSLIINRWHIQNVKPWGTLTRFLLFIIQFIHELAKRILWLTIVISFWMILVDFFNQIFTYNERKQSHAHEKNKIILLHQIMFYCLSWIDFFIEIW